MNTESLTNGVGICLALGLRKMVVMLFVGCLPMTALLQQPFVRTGQVFAIVQNTHELQLFTVQAGYNSISNLSVGSLPAAGLNAMGFRRTDNFLYAIGGADQHLYRIGQDAVVQDLGGVGLDNDLFYLAGDVSTDGNYLMAIGSDAAGNDVQFARINLETLVAERLPVFGLGQVTDLAVEPASGLLFGFDAKWQRMVRIDPQSLQVTPLATVTPGNLFYGLYFDAFGDLYGVGSTLFGIVDGYFKIDPSSGIETRLATGPSSALSDLAACPFSVELKTQASPGVALPCSEMLFQYTLANGSGELISGVDFIHPLPAGFQFLQVQQNTFGALVDTQSMPGHIRLQNLNLAPGVRHLTLKMRLGDIPKARYNSQPYLKNLPALYGLISRADDALEPGFEDSTAFIVNRFDEDTLSYLWFICHGESLELDASEFGGNVQWNTGTLASALLVDKGGIYAFKAGNSCEEVSVQHDVTSASCPYTIAVMHTFEPDTVFACNDLIFRFLIRNDSGEPRFGISFCDTLPTGFTFQEVVRNPYGGTSAQASGASMFCLDGMTLKEGTDTLEIRVRIEDLSPGNYKNRAYLHGIPLVMGPFRQSDNPYTFPFDSSVLVVKGALSDSLLLDTLICAGTEITLDGSSYGVSFLWPDGSAEAQYTAGAPGIYTLQLFDGCTPAQIIWTLHPAPMIDILPSEAVAIHQGESIVLSPVVQNAGAVLQYDWFDPLSGSLSCLNCPQPVATPLESAEYLLTARNEWCKDSTWVQVLVDQHRRIYFPNVFSPNDDGLHDAWQIQSPDYAFIRWLSVYDRWGNLLCFLERRLVDDYLELWNGRDKQGREMPQGVYTWQAEIEFIDGKTKIFTGDLTLLR